MSINIILVNKKIKNNYKVIKTYESGIILTGSEIKSIRNSEVLIDKSFIIIKKNEVFIINMIITKYKFSTIYSQDTKKTRKLLLHKKEIKKILQQIKFKKLTLIPLKIYIKNNYAKIEIALAIGMKKYDKRELIKKRDNKKIFKKILNNKFFLI